METQPAPRSGVAVASLILGISSIAFAGFGLITGIIALIVAHRAQKKEPHARSFWMAGRITAIIGIILNVIGTAIVIVFFFFLAGATPWSSTVKAYEAQVAEQKEFTGRTMSIGNIDLTITDIVRNYQPTTEEKTERPSAYLNPLIDKEDWTPKMKASVLTEETEEYVLITGVAKDNNKPPVALHDSSIQAALLNGYPYAFTSGAYGLWSPQPRDRQSRSPENFRAVYRIEKGSTAIVFSYHTAIYRSVSPIVGTEGARSTKLIYTLPLQ